MIEFDTISEDESKIPEGKKVFWQCSMCGNCCRWPGEVVVNDSEIEAIASHISMNVSEFTQKFTKLRLNRTGLTLIEKENGECIFLNDQGLCSVNPAKPDQCAGFPNAWNFDGWQDVCEAKPILIDDPNTED